MQIVESTIHSQIRGRHVRNIAKDAFLQDLRKNPECFRDLKRMGIVFDDESLNKIFTHRKHKYAMDSLQPTVTTGSMPIPIQFLEKFLPGFVYVVTERRKADDLMGISTIGDWFFNEIVQGILEPVNSAVPYDDYSNVPYSSWNVNWVFRTIIRFEEGMRVGVLEEKQSAMINVDTAAAKRQSAALALEISRNQIGFLGYNAGNNFTYGFLNDPQLPAYYEVPVGVSTDTQWSTKTLLEITADIRTMVETLRNNSAEIVDPEVVDLTLALPTSVVDYLTTISDFGYSVRKWMTDTYPRMRVVSAPELNNAHDSLNVGYLYAENVNDGMSSDGGNVWEQVVPAKFLVTGVAKYEKYYAEDYSNATAGALLKRPFAVVRNYGI